MEREFQTDPMTDVLPAHANPAKQKRSQRSLERIIAAAKTVLERDGWDQLTMIAVANEAGVSIGGIYRRFSSKEQLLRAVKDQVYSRSDLDQKQIVESCKATDLAGAVAHYVNSRIDSFQARSAVMREILEGQNRDQVMEDRGRRSLNLGLRTFRSIIAPFRDEIRHPDPELAIDVAFYMMIAGFVRRVRMPDCEPNFDHIDWDCFRKEIPPMIAGYLKTAF